MYLHKEFLIGTQEFGVAIDLDDWGLDAEIEYDWNGDVIRYLKVGPIAVLWNTVALETAIPGERLQEAAPDSFWARWLPHVATNPKKGASGLLRVSAGPMPPPGGPP